MFNITILAIGKIKEKHYQAAFEEYLKRLKPYAKIIVQELKVESFNEGNKNKAKDYEAQRILAYLKKYPESQVFILDEHGPEYTSLEFTKILEKTNSHFIFVIGGSLGYVPEVLKRYEQHLSLSKMTMPHELARVVLIEQLYRAVTIVNKKEYHY